VLGRRASWFNRIGLVACVQRVATMLKRKKFVCCATWKLIGSSQNKDSAF
jgi:hypothetical protein